MNEESGFLKVPVAGETLYKITLLSTMRLFMFFLVQNLGNSVIPFVLVLIVRSLIRYFLGSQMCLT